MAQMLIAFGGKLPGTLFCDGLEDYLREAYADIYGAEISDDRTEVVIYYHNHQGKRMRETHKYNDTAQAEDIYRAAVAVMEQG